MDVESLIACLERYHQESYGWARFCCRREADEAENVLQTVYLKILEQRAVFDGRASFRTWLFGVIRITASEFRRRRVLQKLHILRYHGSQQPQTYTSSADDTLYGAQRESEIRKALAAMPRRQAEVLQLVFYHDLSLAEAAQAIGVSSGSARTHYERGKKRLRILLEESAWNDRRRF